jgi:small neutral amino acid transporter SnatA (MarC family)
VATKLCQHASETAGFACYPDATMNYTFASATILLILITDPVGNIPIFANALRSVPPERRAWVILREVLIAFVLLLTFMFVGEGFLRLMNLSELSCKSAAA